MSSVLTFGRKVKQRTQAPKIEETPESKRVRELIEVWYGQQRSITIRYANLSSIMQEVEDSEEFFSIMLAFLQKSIALSKSTIIIQ